MPRSWELFEIKTLENGAFVILLFPTSSRMVEEILDTRVMVKKAMKEQKNDKVCELFKSEWDQFFEKFLVNINCPVFVKVLGQLLDARQLGLKLIANVTYGYTSANFSGRMPCVEVFVFTFMSLFLTYLSAINTVESGK